MRLDGQGEQRGILWLKLSEESRNLILERFPPIYPTIYCDHITLAYDVPHDEVSHFIGNISKAEAYAAASNDKVEAIRVITHGLPDMYGVLTLPYLPLRALSHSSQWQC